MPELPDITVYIEALEPRILNERIERARVESPFLVRTFEPPIAAIEGRSVTCIKRIGKRIAMGLEDNLWLVLHLMIAGRLHWREPGVSLRSKQSLAAFDFTAGSLLLTEAGAKRRASLHVIQGAAGVDALDRGGLEVLLADLPAFRDALTVRNHTLKRALTDPGLFSGIGNAYSDEILHRARLSPIAHTQKLSEDEIATLYSAVRDTLEHWTNKLRAKAGDDFPEKVTAFRPEMVVHGRFGQPCPECGTSVARIRYAANETNYCPRCQTGGKLLADRSLSRLLKSDWPRSIDELE